MCVLAASYNPYIKEAEDRQVGGWMDAWMGVCLRQFVLFLLKHIHSTTNIVQNRKPHSPRSFCRKWKTVYIGCTWINSWVIWSYQTFYSNIPSKEEFLSCFWKPTFEPGVLEGRGCLTTELKTALCNMNISNNLVFSWKQFRGFWVSKIIKLHNLD